MTAVVVEFPVRSARLRQKRRWRDAVSIELLLNAAATLQAVWFYLAYVRCYVDLGRFEAGAAHTPFQYRLLLMLPLRWAHGSAACVRVAAGLTHLHAWFPLGVRPESLVEFPVNVAAVAVAGWVARRIYLASSTTGVLAAAVYPLTLLMVLGTYALGTMYRLRFVYDLPSLGFFAVGMYLLYFRKPRWQFAGLFVVATINRETTLFLLAMLVLAGWARAVEAAAEEIGQEPVWLREARCRGAGWPVCLRAIVPELAQAALLLVLWCAWHAWVAHRFAANGTDGWSRLGLNLKVLLIPVSWLQLMSCFAFCGPLVLLWRAHLQDRLLRTWLWVVPVWILFMLRYGLLLESRIFGELIPLIACCMALGAEGALLQRLHAGRIAAASAFDAARLPWYN